MYKYPLQVYPWSFSDRLKVSAFVLNPANRLTMDKKVKEYEECFEKYYNNKVKGIKAIAVTSGSQANELMLQTWLSVNNINIKDVTFFCNSTTWSSNLSPIVIRGGNIELIDINKHDLSMDYEKLETALKNNKSIYTVIWITSLIGFSPNIDKLIELKSKYRCKMFADLCESSFSEWQGLPLCNFFDMSTTSTFLAHFTCSIEGGILLIKKNQKKYKSYERQAQLIRNHGLTRCLEPNDPVRVEFEQRNPLSDPQFLFKEVGTNLRMSEIHALYGILDFKRVPQYIENRKKLYNYFLTNLSHRYYKDFSKEVIPFCLPIITDINDIFLNIQNVKLELNKAGWETRPIICDMSIAPAYRYLAKGQVFENSKWLRENGCYVGLSNNLKIKDIDNLLEVLNNV